mmetsp:Transcript_99108/g.167041  ORF Transcript_99108/g.167041 Transcript_99108/m.167041 type:complete len:100 (-) Transcript_99108:99-398(-)
MSHGVLKDISGSVKHISTQSRGTTALAPSGIGSMMAMKSVVAGAPGDKPVAIYITLCPTSFQPPMGLLMAQWGRQPFGNVWQRVSLSLNPAWQQTPRRR